MTTTFQNVYRWLNASDAALDHESKRRQTLLICLLFLFYAACFGFWSFVSQRISADPFLFSDTSRLSTTLGVWRSQPVSSHFFLFFLTPEDVQSRTPYGNMPYLLGLFYASYHTVINFLTLGRWPLQTTYLMTLAALLGASWFVVAPLIARSSIVRALGILFLSAAILLTSPFFLTYMGTAHDTFFAFSAAAAVVVGFAIVRGPESLRSPIFWIALGFCAINHLLGLIMLGCCFLARDQLPIRPRVLVILLAIAVVNVLIPILLSKYAFGKSSASGMGFRTGLDGSTQYLKSHWQAIISPTAIRSIDRVLGMKCLVFFLILTALPQYRSSYLSALKAAGIALIPYAVNWIFFPQAVSIHPYLYDLLFIIPIDIVLVVFAALVLGNASDITRGFRSAIAIGAVALLIHDNLLQLAQGKILGYN